MSKKSVLSVMLQGAVLIVVIKSLDIIIYVHKYDTYQKHNCQVPIVTTVGLKNIIFADINHNITSFFYQKTATLRMIIFVS